MPKVIQPEKISQIEFGWDDKEKVWVQGLKADKSLKYNIVYPDIVQCDFNELNITIAEPKITKIKN